MNTNPQEVVLKMLVNILGEPKRKSEKRQQYAFNCPACDLGRNKANLEINIGDAIYHCWSCEPESDFHKGSLYKFFKNHGSKDDLKIYKIFFGHSTHKELEVEHKVELPEGFISFEDIVPFYPPHNQANKYIRSRGVTDDIIKKYKIGLTTKGKFANRIIFPSYDKNGELNFFVARTWGSLKPKYLNCDSPKTDVLFNEHLIDWENDIYIVEGPFDSLFVENSVVVLGSELHHSVLEKIYNNCKANVIIGLDPDAKKKAEKIYHELNAGRLWGKIKMLSLPEGEDIASLKGNVSNYFKIIK